MSLMVQTAQKSVAPPLKWAGGKRWLVPRLRELWAAHAEKRLVEPFVGGMSVALGLLPEQALLNDVNKHLINFYKWVQEGFVIETEFENDSEYFYKARKRFNELITSGHEGSKEAAELFYYLNRTGFNGLCRFNRSGQFNVPFGRYKTINYADDFLELQEIIQDWTFISGDFEAAEPAPDDLIYADPPYDSTFTAYSDSPFGWEEQKRLAHWLADSGATVIASNQATQRILKLYESLGFTIEELDAPRRISSNGDRTPAKEMLAILEP